jgi:hypothetical protein
LERAGLLIEDPPVMSASSKGNLLKDAQLTKGHAT